MAEKERRNVSLPTEVNDKLNRAEVNASGLITQLLEAYFAHGDADDAAAFTAERRQKERRRQVRNVCERLDGLPDDRLTRWNDGVVRQAANVGVPPARLVSIIQHYRETDEVSLEPGVSDDG